MAEKSYAVLGLGRYGMRVAETIAKTGATVLVADSDSEKIDTVGNQFTSAMSFDMTNAAALRDIGLENIDIVIIDLAGDLEGSIMCTMIAEESGVERIIATAGSNRSGEVLKRLGADEVVVPEYESALRLAKSLISEDFLEYTDLGDELCIVKISVKEEWDNKTIRRLKLHEKNGITIVAVYGSAGLTADFTADFVLHSGVPIVLAMHKDALYQFV